MRIFFIISMVFGEILTSLKNTKRIRIWWEKNIIDSYFDSKAYNITFLLAAQKLF